MDFQVHRPLVRIDETGTRELVWPDTNVWIGQDAADHLAFVTGHEPNYGWKDYCDELIAILAEHAVERLVTLGAFAGEVPHTAPVPLIGSSTGTEDVERYGLMKSNYEGPTGIVGSLNSLAAEAGMSVLSIWAAVPHYLSNQEYPPGALALLEKLKEILGVPLDTSTQFEESATYRRNVDLAVSQSDIREYVQGLEAESLTGDSDSDPAGQLVEEIERYLNEG